MAKKLIARTEQNDAAQAIPPVDHPDAAAHPAVPEHGLVGDVVFDPPLTPEERRQVGVGIPIEERIEQARRQIADVSARD